MPTNEFTEKTKGLECTEELSDEKLEKVTGGSSADFRNPDERAYAYCYKCCGLKYMCGQKNPSGDVVWRCPDCHTAIDVDTFNHG